MNCVTLVDHRHIKTSVLTLSKCVSVFPLAALESPKTEPQNLNHRVTVRVTSNSAFDSGRGVNAASQLHFTVLA